MTATTFTTFPRFEVRMPSTHPDHMIYMRRRLLVGIVFVALLAALGLFAQSILADHGGVPASVPVVQPAVGSAAVAGGVAAGVAFDVAPSGAVTPAPVSAAGTLYLVQPGDTIWRIAETWHGGASIADYVERLVHTNDGASLQAGQLLLLP